MSPKHATFLAIDIGAESGRGMRGAVDDRTLTVEECRRFPNRPLALPDRLAWNATGLLDAALDCVASAGPVRSLAVDTWGVDFGLLRRDGSLCAPPRSYRDTLAAGIIPFLYDRVPAERLYARTGIQTMEINTLCQLTAMTRAGLAELDEADRLLLMPDLLQHWLGADQVSETTNASTTQMLGTDGAWAADVVEACGVSARILAPLVQPGTELGRLSARHAGRTGGSSPAIVAAASHDTASAVVGTPLGGPDEAYISSGTWSLVGVERPGALLTEAARAANLTNERGHSGTVRLLRNVMGLWLLQRCRMRWADDDGVAMDYETLVDMARIAPPFGAVVDPDSVDFLRAEDVPATIATMCHAGGQPVPGTRGAVVRCVLESLALRYRWVIEALGAVTGTPVRVIHVVGGGSRNDLLCSLTADACARPVHAGPVEATALGNVVLQAIAAGVLGGVADGRALISASHPPRITEPHPDDRWDQAYARFLDLPGVTLPPRPLQPAS